ncbi:MAG: Na+/H+ antiporter [Anaerolineae bacterium]
MEGFPAAQIRIVEILIVVSLVAVLARRFKLPYTVALVLAGLGLTLQTRLHLELTPNLVLAIFLPPLVFEAAFHLQFRNLQEDISSILALAVPGMALSTALVGGLLFVARVLPLPAALLFGALISATDPVSVVATFRALGAPRRLTILVEAESLFNDGTAIVVFQIMLGLVLAGSFSVAQGMTDFVRVSLGGLAIGLVFGYVVALMIGRIDDYLIEITLTTVLAYGSYLVAEELHLSGVLAVVMAGLINGNIGPRRMSPSTRIVLFNFWEYVAFLSNSFVFLLIGMNVVVAELLRYLQPVLIAVAAVLMVRAATVYGLGALVRLFKRNVPLSHLHVMVWGGLRGAVSLALALSLPYAVAERRQLLAMAFGVVLFTLLAQATTIPFVLRRLGFTRGADRSLAYQRLQGELLAARAARQHIDRLHDEGALIPRAWTIVDEELKHREEQVLAAIDNLFATHPEFQVEVVTLARREALRAQRAALAALAREGLLSEEIMHQLQVEVDAALQTPHEVLQRAQEAETAQRAEAPPL